MAERRREELVYIGCDGGTTQSATRLRNNLRIRHPCTGTDAGACHSFFGHTSHTSLIMVKVEIVEEKDANASPYASSDSSRSSSSVSLSSVDSTGSVDESFFDRVVALKDIVSPTTRHNISTRVAQTASVVKRGGKLIGNIIWVLTTSTLLIGLPLALIIEDESKAEAQEKEMLEQQQGVQQVGTLPLCSIACSSLLDDCADRVKRPRTPRLLEEHLPGPVLSLILYSIFVYSFLMAAMTQNLHPPHYFF